MTTLTIGRQEDLLFGIAPKPVECGFGIRIGGGEVLPEVNFTLPTISIEAATWPEVVTHYEEMVKAILRRAVALRVHWNRTGVRTAAGDDRDSRMGSRDHLAPEAGHGGRSLRSWPAQRAPCHADRYPRPGQTAQDA